MKGIFLVVTALTVSLAIPLHSQQYIADYTIANEEVLRSIPEEYINKARTEFVVAYQHTSHGTHVSYGVFGLPDYTSGDEQLFGVSASESEGKLHFRDYALASYSPTGIDGSDLSRDETAFIQTTRNFLDASENADVNVVMWSWCNIAGHNVSGNYLPGMDSLISEYGTEGTKIGTGEGQRENSVDFIFMTGHANENANTGDYQPKPQAELITNHCNSNEQFCLDYYSIDSHDMDDNYWEDVGDNGNSSDYGGNFYEDWQNSHVINESYYGNRETPGGNVVYGAHNSQHITANRKAYAFWWILARMAGWDGDLSTTNTLNTLNTLNTVEPEIYPNPCSGTLYFRDLETEISEIRLVRSDGVIVCAITRDGSEKDLSIDLSDYSPGFYGVTMATESGIKDVQIVLLIH